MEMLREMGFCSGIENYSRILDKRQPGERPYCLIDYFPKDFICFIDESHQTVPQIGGMYEGDRSRKQTLVDYGFRLPSALDNRPQRFEEFLSITPQLLFVSATPGEYERSNSTRIVEQIVRPTGIVDPRVEVRETKNQIDDLMNEVRKRVERNERVLVTTLTKKMSEDLSQYLLEMGFKTRYLHSEIDTLERIQIIRDLRLGEYDVLVGVNLLREGLDLPEVSLVAILDADKEGFLRGETSLIQTIGRAARNVDGTVLMYADKETKAMKAAISETDRRREIQVAYNEQHGITAATIVKGISDIAEFLQAESKVPRAQTLKAQVGDGRRDAQARARADGRRAGGGDDRGGRRAALRVRRAAARRAARAAPRPARDPGQRGSAGRRRRCRADPGPARRRSRCSARPRRATSPRMRAVDIDRQAIERRDFPISRRGYEPAAVDAHLRALAAEIEQLQRELSDGGGQVFARLDARGRRCRASSPLPRRRPPSWSATRRRARARRARTPIATPRARARRRSRRRAARLRSLPQAAAALLERVSSMDAEVGALVESVRAGANRLAADLGAVEDNMSELYDAASGKQVTRAVAGDPITLPSTPAPAPPPASPQLREPSPALPATQPAASGAAAPSVRRAQSDPPPSRHPSSRHPTCTSTRRLRRANASRRAVSPAQRPARPAKRPAATSTARG